jgi:hypothetical protein
MDHLTTAQLITRGRELSAIIDQAEKELEAIESILRSRALAMPHEPLAEGNREGRRARLRDHDQEISVLFESDILKASFAADSPVAARVIPLLTPQQSAEIFRLKQTYERIQKDGHRFRLAATETLGPDLAAQVIDQLKDRDKSGIVKSKSVIEWNGSNA